MTMNEFILKAMSVPFKEKGRDYDGVDCFGIVYLGFRDVFNIQLPKYTDDYKDAGASSETRRELSELISLNRRKWEAVKNYHPMDVALFTLGGTPIHVGLMVDQKNFIHCEKKIGTVIESINSIMWNRRLDGVFRLCQA